MELDVHLTRESDEPWGLEFSGGLEYGTPLTIDQVDPASPADAAGLQPGDRVTRVGDRLASELTQLAARTYLSDAVGSVSFGLCRGLYDPVLNDFEAIYEPVERADSDLRSEPTEVSPPRCVDFPELPLSDLYDFRPVTESRSLTASPFQTKPYRPFSTEPLNILPLEDPIILNPKFKDNFAEILDGIDIDNVETKYKLPVSQQYDPNYKKKVDGILEKSMERDVQKGLLKHVEETDVVQHIDVMQLTDKQVRFEEMKVDADIVNIERAAIDFVDESIERAVSVTEEIQEAFEEELRASATPENLEKVELIVEEISDRKEANTSEMYKEEIRDEVVNISRASEMEVFAENSEKVAKQSKKVSEVTVAENSETVTEPKELLYIRENKNKTKTHEVKTERSEFKKANYEDTETRKESDGKQKVFNIGLQTIPNIKGMVHSSCHFDLLMRTFFIHLTDVMVAMSRFILTQPALELEAKAERVIKDKLIIGLEREGMKNDLKSQEFHKSQTSDVRKNVEIKKEFNATNEENISQRKHVQQHSEIKTQDHLDMELEEIERRRLSGAQMAQMTQRKPKELTHRMDAVISEFETKTGIDDSLEVKEQRRSRSRSRIEEEVMSESDPLEWLSKKESHERTSFKTSSHTESKERRSEHESREVRTSTTKPGKQMYVAVVESHVYTNKDAVLQEMLETSSIESTEEMNADIVEKQQAVEVITQALESNVTSIAESTVASAETTEVSLESTKEFTERKVSKHEAVETKQEYLTTVASETTEIVEDMQAESFNVLEVSETTAVTASEENYKATAVQSTQTLLEETREETTELQISEKHATSKIEHLSIAVAESTDIVDSIVETFETEESKVETAVVKAEESFRSAAIETTEISLEEAVEQHTVSVETGHAAVKETESLAVAGIIETMTELDKIKPPKAEDEFASLKIIKQEVIEDASEDITEITESEVVKKSVEIESFVSHDTSSFQSKKLHLRTDLTQSVISQSSVESDENNNIDTPTPSTVPPTPLTDEYVFKLQIPLPKNTGPIIKEDSPDHEDLSIVKKKLIPHIETSIDEPIIYDPPLPTPTEDKIEPVYTKLGLNGGNHPVYIKPGLRGGGSIPCYRREYIREIERKSSLLASAIDQTIKSIEEYKEEVGIDKIEEVPEVIEVEDEEARPEDELDGFRAVPFAPERLPKLNTPVNVPVMPVLRTPQPYLTEAGEPLGTVQGIIDGLEDATVDEEVAKELGRPGLTENKIAELISGESEMLREAHVMGLTRVITSHMSKPDDSSVDFNKIKPLMESLKHSQVIAALNEELMKRGEAEKKKEERKWTKFLQKPQRPAPRAKSGYYGFLPQEESEEGPYKVKIVKQPKPKVAPDYKPEDFETGPLPWEQRALTEPAPPPVALEDPILIPEEGPEFLEAVDPLTESEVPDLQDTGIVLPPPKPDTPETILEKEEPPGEEETVREEEVIEEEVVKEEKEMKGEVEEMAEQLVQNVKSMVDPHAPIQQQLTQMRAQLAALAQLPCVIQQSLEMLTNHLDNISHQETRQVTTESQIKTESFDEVELRVSAEDQVQYHESEDNEVGHVTVEEIGALEQNENTMQEEVQAKITLTAEEYAALKKEEEMMLEEQMKSEKLKKVQEKIEQESRQLKQRGAPRVGKPKPVFGPQNPEVRPLVLPGGRRWKGPKDVFNDQFIAETLQAQSEIIQGKVMGINFMKYEKPPVNLDHLQHSDVYKAVHGMEVPMRRVDLLTPVVAEADYRERCRSMTPSVRFEEHLDIPQQLQP